MKYMLFRYLLINFKQYENRSNSNSYTETIRNYVYFMM